MDNGFEWHYVMVFEMCMCVVGIEHDFMMVYVDWQCMYVVYMCYNMIEMMHCI